MKKVVTTICLDAETYYKVKDQAKKEGRSLSSYLSYYIKRVVTQIENPEFHKKWKDLET